MSMVLVWITYTIKKMMRLNSLTFTFLILLVGCESQPGVSIPDPQIEKELFYLPSNFPYPVYNIDDKPVTQAGFELGKKIFYDGRLSKDGTISCAECHSQPYAFTHHGHMLSHGIDNRVGTRNAPPIQNMAFQKSFMWDGGVFDLDMLSIAPITNPVEMDESLANVLAKLKSDKDYPVLFEKAYGSTEINSETFLKAVAQFMNSLISANSKYDKYVRNEEGGDFTEEETAGLRLFEQKCASCHSGSLFTDQSFRNNGLIIYPRDTPDPGRFLITQNEEDINKFKVPSLRNIAKTAPYMHDGRFGSLNSVLNHYQEGVSDTQNLDPILKQNGKLGIELTDTEKVQIIAFLNTLTDNEFLTDQRFAAP